MKKSKVKEKILYPVFDVLLNGFNYGFHIYTSWYLIKNSYAILNAYLAVVSLLMVIGIALQSYSAKVTAGVDIKSNRIELMSPITLMGVPLIILLLLSPIITPFLKGNFVTLVVVSLLLMSHSILSCGRGVMQGQGDFFKLNISFYIEVVLKIVLLVALLPRARNIEIPLIVILIGYVFALFHLLYYYKYLNGLKIKWLPIKNFFKDRTILVFILSQLFIYSYFSLDMILVNGLHSEVAPMYAVVQKFGMIQFFVGSSLMAVFLPELADHRIDNHTFSTRWKKCLLILISVLALFQLFYHLIFPLLVPFMFGDQYLLAAKWVPYGGFTFALLVILNFFVTTLLARAKVGFNKILFIGAISVSIGIIISKNIFQILIIEGITFLIVNLALFTTVYKEINILKKRIGTSNKKTILFLSWRDIKAPKMGGAEIYTHEMLSRMNRDNYRIIHFSPLFNNGLEEEDIDGIKYFRSGSIFSVIKKAKEFYKINRDNIDYVVNQCNTHRFFTKFWVESKKRIFFIHQLTRKIWFYHTSFPFNFIGYLLESPLLKLNKNDLTITVSESTKTDLVDLGFDQNKIGVMPEGLNFTPWDKDRIKPKESSPTFIYVGRFAEYKGIDDTLVAFTLVKKEFPDSKIWIVGKPNMNYIEKKLTPICVKNGLTYTFDNENADVIYKGFVTDEKKLELMSRAHLLVFPSLREGWGLTISEAAAVGTPSLVYDAPGTRDAVLNGSGGYMVKIGDINGLKNTMIDAIYSKDRYLELRDSAYEFSKTLHWDNTGECFTQFCNERL